MLFVLFCVVTLTSVLASLMKGGPFDRERKVPESVKKELEARYNLGGTKWQNYVTYLGLRENATGKYSGLLEGDLQPSLKYRSRTVAELLAQTLPVTFTLGLMAFLIATTAGIWLGSWAAVRHHTAVDTWAMIVALLAVSIPTFVTGPLLILFFVIKLNLLPVGGWNGWESFILPSITLASPYVAYIARLMRTSMLEVLGQDYVRTARAKGLSEMRIIYKHALKTAVMPVVSFAGPLAANLLTGSLVVETVFNIPGAGVFLVNSIRNRDGFLLCGVVIVYCALLVLLNLLVDVAYTLLDRRIKLYE